MEKPTGLKQSPAKTVTHVDTVILGRDIGHSQESWRFFWMIFAFLVDLLRLDVYHRYYTPTCNQDVFQIRVEGFDLRNYYTNTYCDVTYHSPAVSGTKK